MLLTSAFSKENSAISLEEWVLVWVKVFTTATRKWRVNQLLFKGDKNIYRTKDLTVGFIWTSQTDVFLTWYVCTNWSHCSALHCQASLIDVEVSSKSLGMRKPILLLIVCCLRGDVCGKFCTDMANQGHCSVYCLCWTCLGDNRLYFSG